MSTASSSPHTACGCCCCSASISQLRCALNWRAAGSFMSRGTPTRSLRYAADDTTALPSNAPDASTCSTTQQHCIDQTQRMEYLQLLSRPASIRSHCMLSTQQHYHTHTRSYTPGHQPLQNPQQIPMKHHAVPPAPQPPHDTKHISDGKIMSPTVRPGKQHPSFLPNHLHSHLQRPLPLL